MTIGERIKTERKKAGMTQAVLGEKCGMPDSQIRQYESSSVIPRADTIQRIAAALGVLPGDLLQDGIYPTSQEMTAMRRAAENVTDERKAEIEEKRLGNLIKRKAELLNNTGKQKAVDYMTDLSGHPDYKK